MERMPDATPVLVQAYRTPQGKEDGLFAGTRSEDLSIPLIDEILAETGLSSEQVDDLIWGCAQQRDEQGNNLARIIALLSDLGENVPATTINRWCERSPARVVSASVSPVDRVLDERFVPMVCRKGIAQYRSWAAREAMGD